MSEAILKRVRAAIARDELARACALLRLVLAADPGQHMLWVALASLELDRGRLVESQEAIRRAEALAPADPRLAAVIAAHCRAEGDLVMAERTLAEALRQWPDHLPLWQEIGTVHLLRGSIPEARGAFQRVLNRDPSCIEAITGLGVACERSGKLELARSLLEPLIADHWPTLAAWARTVRQMGDSAAAVAPLRAFMKRKSGSAAARSKLAFELGACLDAMGDLAGAARAFHDANAATGAVYDPAAHRAFVDGTIERWNREELRSAPRAHASHRPILVVGMPRSGTTLVERVLSRHPIVTARGERPVLPALAQDFRSRPERAAELGDTYAAILDAERATDKLPDNYLWLAEAAMLAPNAHVVHVVRDAEDTALSCWQQDFGRRLPYTTRMDWLTSRREDHDRLMDHWSNIVPMPICRVDYETLVSRPEATIRALLSFVDLPFHADCLSPHAHEGRADTASYAQVRAPIHDHAVGRGAAYRAHLGA